MADQLMDSDGGPESEWNGVPIEVEVENIGGIDSTSTTFEPGITVLEGRNATNRTSFLKALMAALGSDDVTLKADADEGLASITLGNQTYQRRLVRQGDSVETQGSPFLEDPTIADLFAFLLESNEARQAIARDGDLYNVIMEPVDTSAIEREIRALEREKSELDDELEALSDLESKKTELQQRREELDGEIEELETELEQTEDQIEKTDKSVEETTDQQAELQEKLDMLQRARSELEDVRYNLETAEESLQEFRTELEEVKDAIESSDGDERDPSEIKRDLSELHDRKQSLTNQVNQLKKLVQFNEDQLDESADHFLEELHGSPSDAEEGVTEKLVHDHEVVCWTCGSVVDRPDIEEIIEDLRTLCDSKLEQRREIETQIQELQEEKRTIQETRQRLDRLESERDHLKQQIEDTTNRIDSLKDRRETLLERVGELEAKVEELRAEEQSELLELHRQANEIEFQLDRLADERESVEDQLQNIDDRLDRREEVSARREQLGEELTDLRTKVERIEEDAVETFNTQMEKVLDRLEYENIERIWIERRETSVREGRQKITKGVFELHVVRQSPSGTLYEDTVDHLSESEREVVGLVFALAGYLAHDVHERVPFMILDSLEALDSERIASLVDYLSEYVDNIVVALLPEDAAALTQSYERVTAI